MRTNWYNKSMEMNDIMPAVLFGVEEPRFGMKDRMTAAMNCKPTDDVDTFDNLNVNLWNFGLRTPDGSEKVRLKIIYFERSYAVTLGPFFWCVTQSLMQKF